MWADGINTSTGRDTQFMQATIEDHFTMVWRIYGMWRGYTSRLSHSILKYFGIVCFLICWLGQMSTYSLLYHRVLYVFREQHYFMVCKEATNCVVFQLRSWISCCGSSYYRVDAVNLLTSWSTRSLVSCPNLILWQYNTHRISCPNLIFEFCTLVLISLYSCFQQHPWLQ